MNNDDDDEVDRLTTAIKAVKEKIEDEAKRQAEEKARLEEEARAKRKAEAQARAKREAEEARAKAEEAEAKQRQEAETKARQEAEFRAKREAEAKAARAKEEAEARAKAKAEAEARVRSCQAAVDAAESTVTKLQDDRKKVHFFILFKLRCRNTSQHVDSVDGLILFFRLFVVGNKHKTKLPVLSCLYSLLSYFGFNVCSCLRSIVVFAHVTGN